MSQEKKVEVRATLKGKTAKKFLDIKAYMDLENDTEVVRSLISEFHRAKITGANEDGKTVS